MCRWIIVCFAFFISFNFRAKAAVFVVTSNADSGPGTLREALTLAAANGSAEKDYINFNLPGSNEASRTITITSALPFISSNLVVDGTTQPGGSFGRSNAKVVLQPNSPNAPFNALACVDVNGFEIYGMYIRDFTGQFANGSEQGVYTGASAVYLETSDNIQIGAPGKGNVFVNNSYVTFTDYVSLKTGSGTAAYGVNNLKVYANFLGVEPDGKSLRGGVQWGIDVSYCKGNIEIGGDDISKRNIFANDYLTITGFFTGPDRLFKSDFLIENNYFNYDIDGSPIQLPDLNSSNIYAIFFDISRWIYYYDRDNITYPYTFQILNNKIQYPYTVEVGTTSGPITFQGNKILYEPTTINTTFGYSGGVGFRSLDNIKVGGVNTGEANEIYGSQLYLFSRKSILLQRNSIYCVGDAAVWVPAVAYLDPPLPLPVVEIKKVTASSVSGTATPLSKVELFWDDDCPNCQPYTYVATVDADANGNWQYNGVIQKGIIASATLGSFTSVFTILPTYSGATVKHTSCGKNDGSITDIIFKNAGGFQWKNDQGQVIPSVEGNLKNLAPGKYTLYALNGTCSNTQSFDIYDATPKIIDSYKIVTQPSCSNKSGSITGLILDNYDVISQAYNAGNNDVYTFKWFDVANNIVGTDFELTGVGPGSYHLQISYNNDCPVEYGPVILKNTTGPNIDQTGVKIRPTNCGQSDGSITNLAVTGTGTLQYLWWNSQQQQVGTAKDLTGQPAGTYKLQVLDDTQCGPIYTTDITIPETNGIIMDESKVIKTVASCGQNNGTVTGITVQGATKYQWTDINNNIVSTTADLTGVPSGDYTLTASNNFGCSKASQPYHIDLQAVTLFPQYAASIISSCFRGQDGSIAVTTDALVKTLRWVDSQGTNAGNQPALTGVKAGDYKLYLTDQNGCEQLYQTYTVGEEPEYAVASTGEIANDQCGLKTGSVSNVAIAGGVPPYTYKWTDAANNVIGSTSSIANLAAGNYTLNVIDTRCGNVDIPYTITSVSTEVAPPSVSDVQLCSSGSALVSVNNSSAGTTYRLYESSSSANPITEQQGGRFTVTVSGNRSYFITQLNGTCESSRAEVKITVGLSVIDIANAFTPNGDGINDFWKISNIESYPSSLVQVFTRYGQKVFESRGYAKPFDGTMNGKKIPPGVYYYIINLNTDCNILSGSLTIIR